MGSRWWTKQIPIKIRAKFQNRSKIVLKYSFPDFFHVIFSWCVTQVPSRTGTLIPSDARGIGLEVSQLTPSLGTALRRRTSPHLRLPCFIQGRFASSEVTLCHLRSPQVKGVSHFQGMGYMGIKDLAPSLIWGNSKGPSRLQSPQGTDCPLYTCNKIHPSLWPILTPSLVTGIVSKSSLE